MIDLTNVPTYFKSSARAKQIIHEHAERFGFSLEDLMSHQHYSDLVDARCEAMYQIRLELGWSYPKIGQLFQRHHTTVLNAIRREGKRRVQGLKPRTFGTKREAHQIMLETAYQYTVSIQDILKTGKSLQVTQARYQAMRRLHHELRWSPFRIAKMFGNSLRHAYGIIHEIKKEDREHGRKQSEEGTRGEAPRPVRSRSYDAGRRGHDEAIHRSAFHGDGQREVRRHSLRI